MGGKGSGRKPQPLALKVFRGGRVQNLRTPAEVSAGVLDALPDAPSFLGDEGRKLFESDGEALRAIGVLTSSDVSDFGLICWAWERVLQLMEEAKGSSTVMDEKGNEKIAPALAELRRWLPLLRGMRSDYGLSGPRSRMVTGKPEAELEKATNPLDAFKKATFG